MAAAQGSRGQPYLRLLPARYGPGGGPRQGASGPLPSARALAAALLSGAPRPGPGLSVHAMQWGQFLAHDLTATPVRGKLRCCGEERGSGDCASIPVEAGDPVYGARGVDCLPMVRCLPGPSIDTGPASLSGR
jgi:hypothetical protein